MVPVLLLFFLVTIDSKSVYFSALAGSLQCIHPSSYVSEIHSSFDPRDHVQEYENGEYIETLLMDIERKSLIGSDEPFTNSPEHISDLTVILNALYFNTHDWWLFYNTTAWLVGKVNSAQLYWALSILANEKFDAIVPGVVQTFPQLFIGFRTNEDDRVRHFTSDPGLNEFHTHWHIENPFWWNESFYGSTRERRGELFLYMHHQVLSRYNMERVNNGLEEARSLELSENGVIPEAYYPDVVNINFEPFPFRDDNTKLTDTKYTNISYLETIYSRLQTAIQSSFFVSPNNSDIPVTTNLLGDTTESSSIESANHGFYGAFHNYLHRLIADIGVQETGKHIPGIQAHPETSMRDAVFYQIHTLVDTLYLAEKQKQPPYTQSDLDFPGVEIRSVSIESTRSSDWSWWPPLLPTFSTPTITTYYETVDYDVSTSVRPCRSMHDPPVLVSRRRLNHVGFKYVIRVKNSLGVQAHGIVRVFLLPERNSSTQYTLEEAHARAVELDRFHVNLLPNVQTLITRESAESSVTTAPQPTISPRSRNCGFPSNLLIPRGTNHGVYYKVFTMISKEPESEYSFPDYPYCGALNASFPDTRSMGFPFDRPGTSFKVGWLGNNAYKNVHITRIRVVHDNGVK